MHMNPAITSSLSTAATSLINSIQNFSITIGNAATSNTATITSVTTANSIILYDGMETTNTGTNLNHVFTYVTLTNSTTVTATRNTQTNTDAVTIKGMVVEFTGSKLQSSTQFGTIAIAAASTSNAATITSVNTANALVIFLGTSSTSSALTDGAADVVLTNGTTVTATRVGTSGTCTVSYVVVEFASGIIQSLQTVTNTNATTSNSYTSTITSVTTGNTLLIYGGTRIGSTGTFGQNGAVYARLTNATTVTFTRVGTGTVSRTETYTVLEFASSVVASKQEGTISLASVASNTATVTSVNTAKAILAWSFMDTTSTGGNNNDTLTDLTLTNATTITANKGTAGTNTVVIPYQLMELV